MRGPSEVAILSAGLVVLIVQLVVWLTPARNLIIKTPESSAALDIGETRVTERGARPQSVDGTAVPQETTAQAPSPQGPQTESGMSSTGSEEASVPSEEAATRAPDLSEPETNETPLPSNRIVAEAPAIPEPEAETAPSPTGVEETPVTTDVAQEPTVVEADSDASLSGTQEATVAAEENMAEAPTLSEEPEADAEERVAAVEAAAQELAVPQKLLIVEPIRQKISDPALREGAHPDDLAALETFYAQHSGPALWVTSTGLSPEAQSIIGEIAKADAWGLDPGIFKVPTPDYQPTAAEDQAAAEIALSLAILKYARAARGGLTEPSAVSKVFDQRPSLREPNAVLTEIAASTAPDAYLRDLHPKHAQFDKLRQTLLKAQSDDIGRLKANMERWRWMPEDLGAFYVWLNIPEFMLKVVKDGKTVQSEKIVVGNPSSPTPVLTADMKSIVFNPERVVPLSVIRKDILPKLREGRRLFGGYNTPVLEQYQLTVKSRGKPVDPTKIDWEKVDLSELTFIQAPGPTNILGKVQFRYPNDRDVYMHDAIIDDELKRAARAVDQKEPRVANSEKLAARLLAEDKGWSKAKVDQIVGSKKPNEVKLDDPIPVHMTYFTVVVDEEGQVKTFDDVYRLDRIDKPEDEAAVSSPAAGLALRPSRKPINP